MPSQDQILPFSPIQNSNLFSNHWLEHRLKLEPEWQELREQAEKVLDSIAALWREQRELVEDYGTEAPLEDEWIKPVLSHLGWVHLPQVFIKTRKPDYALFPDEATKRAAVAAGRKKPEFWQYPFMVADAKAWHISLDQPTTIAKEREYPPEQIEWYLVRTRLDFGLLTNGRLWRIIPREMTPEQPRFQTYLECNLPKLLDAWIKAHEQATVPMFFEGERQAIIDDFLTFYLFFSPLAFRIIGDRPSLIQRALDGSSEYRVGVGEGLRQRVFDALQLAIEGFFDLESNGLDPAADMATARDNGFILLYRILFVMYAEDRLLLPHPPNTLYRENRSLRRHRDDIAARIERIHKGRATDFTKDSTDYWDDLRALCDLVNSGNRRYFVPAYNGGLFNPDQHPFLEENSLSDRYVAAIIDKLGRAADPERPELGLFRVDYRDLAIQHLGSVYEGLLELTPHYATDEMIVIRKRSRSKVEERIISAKERLPKGFEATDQSFEPGQVYLLTDKGERRASGSYYTPNHIVDYIVEKTLGPVCDEIDERLAQEIAETEEARKRAHGQKREDLDAKLTRLKNDYDDRILKLNVLDPAMGSGHFLLRGCQYLAEQIATNPNTGDEKADQLDADDSVLTFWKRRVVERCLYGVDLNLMAVELAQLALWLETVAVGQPLSFLNHHLRYGNSLVGADIERLGALPDAREIQQNIYLQQVEQLLPVLLEPLETIRSLPSNTAEDVKKKERLYTQGFDKRRRPFLRIADLWVSTFYTDPDDQPTAEQYQTAVAEVGKPRRFTALTKEPWFNHGLETASRSDVRPFHWLLEFPEVFFDKTGRREDGGFDVVAGNPPYDVLSEKELGHDVSDFKDFIEHHAVFDQSRRGKNNLYKLFVCRSFDLLKDGGKLGQITPMAILGDAQAQAIRQLILDNGAFTSVDAFPQKDDPKRRVFPEAKLSTTVFTAVKISAKAHKTKSFISRVHPGRFFEDDSPRLSLSSEEIPLYDPENLSIVSCDQADWNLATAITRSDRVTRAGKFVEFFQGEVNETNQRKAGTLVAEGEGGTLVTRGACICLYVDRDASQGDDLYLDTEAFLRGKDEETKAYHFRERRVSLQESSPQNNFRRIIACILAGDHFCNHTINYAVESSCKDPLEYMAAMLNTRFADWYFRLGSTNAHVSHYQIYNLPAPRFHEFFGDDSRAMLDGAIAARRRGELDRCFEILEPAMEDPPFGLAVRDFIVELTKRIIQIEKARGEIARTERSHLHPDAQPYQDLIDRIFYRLFGLSDGDAEGLEERLQHML